MPAQQHGGMGVPYNPRYIPGNACQVAFPWGEDKCYKVLGGFTLSCFKSIISPICQCWHVRLVIVIVSEACRVCYIQQDYLVFTRQVFIYLWFSTGLRCGGGCTTLPFSRKDDVIIMQDH